MKNKEMKLYEKLGVREFGWLAFSLRKVFLYPFTIGMSEVERRIFINSPDNYNMGYTRNLKEIAASKNASNKRLYTIKELKQHRNYLESLRRANQAQTVTKESQMKLCYRQKISN